MTGKLDLAAIQARQLTLVRPREAAYRGRITNA